MPHPRVCGGIFPGYDPVQLLYRRGHIYRGGVHRLYRRSHRSLARAGHQPGQISRPHRGQSPRCGGVHLPARAAENARRAVAGGLGARVCGRVRRRHSGARTHRQRVPHGRGVRGARSCSCSEPISSGLRSRAGSSTASASCRSASPRRSPSGRASPISSETGLFSKSLKP